MNITRTIKLKDISKMWPIVSELLWSMMHEYRAYSEPIITLPTIVPIDLATAMEVYLGVAVLFHTNDDYSVCIEMSP